MEAWRESGGPKLTPPKKMGFGVKVVKGEIDRSHSSVVPFDFAETNLSARLEIPLPPERVKPL
jgi:hypothetical protein